MSLHPSPRPGDPSARRPTPPRLASLAWYAQPEPVYSMGNEVTLHKGGHALFAAMCERIDAAREEIWMAVYLVSPLGHSGEVLRALGRAAARGVRVRVVVDGLGSSGAPSGLWNEMRASGMEVCLYRPVTPWLGWMRPRQWRRMHIKIVVIDHECGYIGGINLIDDHYDIHHGWQQGPRLDYALGVRGPAVATMRDIARALWSRARYGHDWRDEAVRWMQDPRRWLLMQRWLTRRGRASQAGFGSGRPGPDAAVGVRCAVVIRDNLRQRRSIEGAVLRAIEHAQRSIDIAMPYFYPRRALRRALQQAAQRGVDVRLLLPGRLDYRIAGLAAQVLYRELQHGGVRIFEYQPAFLHAKVICIDESWATIGSSNLDPLSLVLNLEANLIVDDAMFAQGLAESLRVDFAGCKEVAPPAVQTPPTWRERGRRGLVALLAQLYLRLAGVTGAY